MNEKLLFLYPFRLEKIYLEKDVGLFPLYFVEKYNVKVDFIYFERENKSEVEKFLLENDRFKKINFVPVKRRLSKIKYENIYKESKFKNSVPNKFFEVLKSFGMIFYLAKNSRKYQKIMTFHLTRITCIYVSIYKIFNPKGCIYLKLDIDKKTVDKFKEISESNSLIERLHFKFLKIILKKIDFVSAETITIKNSLRRIFGKDIHYIPNGYDDEKFDLKVNIEEKKNIILYVGRIGSPEKNTELFMEALTKINIKDWKVFFVGPIEPDFREKVNEFETKYRGNEKSIKFFGPIYDKDALIKLYKKSKVFVMSSNSESYGLVLNEALCNLNYIISTNTGASLEVTKGRTLGSVIKTNSLEELTVELNKVINGETKIDFELIKEHSHNFYMSTIIKNKMFLSFFGKVDI